MVSERQIIQHNNSYERVGDWMQFRDPFTGEALSGDRPPSSLEVSAGLKSGFDYLRSHPDTSVVIFGENHGDQSYSNQREVQERIAQADAVFLEGYGHSAECDGLFWSTAHGESQYIPRNIEEALGEFKLRQLGYLEGIQKPVFFPEAPDGGSQYEQELIEFIKILDSIRPLALAGDENFALAVEINLVVSSIMREWYMIGQMGLQMQAYEQVTGRRLKNAMLWIGELHVDTMPNKFRGVGVQVSGVKAKRQVVNTVPAPASGEHRRTNVGVPYVEAARNGMARLIKHA